MKRTFLKSLVPSLTLLVGILFLGAMSSCSKDTTYADQKKAEKEAIENFIKKGANIVLLGDTLLTIAPIQVIDDYQFFAQDSMTDVSQNQYVYFGNSGVYMQIIRKGPGKKIGEGESKRLTARYVEYNIMADSVYSLNNLTILGTNPEILNVVNTYGIFTASFSLDDNEPQGAMYIKYGSTEVPSGWLVPFSYINVGRQTSADQEIAKVRIIVPHSQGTAAARNSVYPAFYEISFAETRN